jgi:hypothetical protein
MAFKFPCSAYAVNRENIRASLKPPLLPGLRLFTYQAATVVYPPAYAGTACRCKRHFWEVSIPTPTTHPKSRTAFLSSLRFFTRIHSHHHESMKSGFQPATLSRPSRDQEAQNSPLLSCSYSFQQCASRTLVLTLRKGHYPLTPNGSSVKRPIHLYALDAALPSPCQGIGVIDNYTIKLSPRPPHLRVLVPFSTNPLHHCTTPFRNAGNSLFLNLENYVSNIAVSD